MTFHRLKLNYLICFPTDATMLNLTCIRLQFDIPASLQDWIGGWDAYAAADSKKIKFSLNIHLNMNFIICKKSDRRESMVTRMHCCFQCTFLYWLKGNQQLDNVFHAEKSSLPTFSQINFASHKVIALLLRSGI